MGAMLSSAIFGKKELQIMVIGRGNAGKTTILHKLKTGEFIVTDNVTVGISVETVEYKDISYVFCEVGGQTPMISLWKHFYPHTPGLIYVVNSNDRSMIEIARNELHEYLNEIEDEPNNGTILVFANKQDLADAMTVSEITDKLDLHSLNRHRWHVQSASAVSGEGLYEGLDWFHNNISSNQGRI